MITSAETSINKRRPAVCGLVRLEAGQVVYDHGCGKYPQYVREWAESQGCEYYGFDPYHSTPADAVKRIGLVFRGGADVVLLSNVLNVISTAESRAACLRAAAARWIEMEYETPYSPSDEESAEEIPFAYTTYGDDEDDVQVYVDAVHLEFIFELNGYERIRQDVDADDIQYVDFSEIIADAYDLLTKKED